MNALSRPLSACLPALAMLLATTAPGPVSDAATPPNWLPAFRIISPPAASPLEQFAAREVRRYVYLRTGQLLPLVHASRVGLGGAGAIVVSRKDRAWLDPLLGDASRQAALARLEPEQFWLKTIPAGGRRVLVLTGGDDVGTLYAAYRFAEVLGVRYGLHGDILPDAPIRLELPLLDERSMPLFRLRGIQPFHDFPEGPDWWNGDDYAAILGQLAKLRMNFLALHTYPENAPNAEPTVWIGLASEAAAGGQVTHSYPASYMNTLRGNWGYIAKKTSDFGFGAANLFEQDAYGAAPMLGLCPQPASPADCNTVFDRTAVMLGDAFRLAHRLGIKTCVGTETPLKVPQAVAERLRAAGRDPSDPRTIEDLYAGIFHRAAAVYPLDYYWFWTPEGWTWEGTKEQQLKATVADLELAGRAAAKVHAPFQLATCGWVLGPQSDRALFDRVLPKSVAVSCINREVGRTPVDPAFAEVWGRSKWAIPWLEDDPGLTSPQLWVGRMRRDAADARRYGCDGLLGIHWRTRVLGPNVAALAQAAWDQSGWNPLPFEAPVPLPRAAGPAGGQTQLQPPVLDFYQDWASHEFGPEIGAEAADIFARVDSALPRPSDWVDGPGGLKPDERPWSEVQRSYEFVNQLAALQPRARGRGNRARLDYWVETFRYLRAIGHLNCAWAVFNRATAQAKAEPDARAQQQRARELVLPLRRQLVALVGEVYDHLLATVSTTGELGTVANWEQHILPMVLTKPGEELARLLGEPLPGDAQPRAGYRGPVRVVVPTLRSSLEAGAPFRLKVLVLAPEPPLEVALEWRRLGSGQFARVAAQHLGRGVYGVELPAATIQDADLEYYVEAVSAGGPAVRFPASAPSLNQTVVILPGS